MRFAKKQWAAGVALGLAVAVAGVGSVSAAFAEVPDDPLALVAAATPDTVAEAAEVPTVSDGENAIDATVADIDVTVPVNAEDGITLDGATGAVSIGLPFAEQADNATVESSGVVSYDNNNGSTTVPVVLNDGSVQINTVIDNPTAPTRYEYPLSLPDGASIQDANGALLFLDAEGSFVGGLAAAWAKDANGIDVPTRYDVNGLTVTQVIDHTASHAYPVVADPWMGTNLFHGFRVSSQNVSILLSGWGRAVHYGVAQGGGAAGVVAGQYIFRGAGWDELRSRVPLVSSKATYKQQYDCHVLGGYWPAGGDTWDLEGWRSSNHNWLNGVDRHRCNW